MTDTADLVKELSPELLAAVLCREVNKNRSGDCACARNGVSIPNYCRQMQDMGKAVHAAIAPMRYALSEAKRERDAYKSSRWHWKQTAVRFAERSNERLARADKLEAEVERLRKKGGEAYALADNCNADKERLEAELAEAKRERDEAKHASAAMHTINYGVRAELKRAKQIMGECHMLIGALKIPTSDQRRLASAIENLAGEADQERRRAESAESSLAAAKERMALVQRCIGARMGLMTPVQRECVVNTAWWLLNDMTGLWVASEKPEFVNRVLAELVRDCADALKTAAGKE